MGYEDPKKRRARNKRYYRKNLARESTRSMEKTRRLIALVKAMLADHLRTHPCVDCGESDHVVLEFDHVRGKKLFTMAQARRGKKRPAAVIEEMGKCVVRCANCHRRRTAKQIANGEIRIGNVKNRPGVG